MLRAVLDPGVLVSAVLSEKGAPHHLLLSWIEGQWELVVSPKLLRELDQVLRREKFRRYLSMEEAAEYVDLLSRTARLVEDPPLVQGLTPDPGDDDLICLAQAAGAHALVSGDPHLTGLQHAEPPILTPRAFLDLIHKVDPLH